jgi:hypothetical protein
MRWRFLQKVRLVIIGPNDFLAVGVVDPAALLARVNSDFPALLSPRQNERQDLPGVIRLSP